MRPTAAQLSGRNSARSSRFAKSVASTIATFDGRPDPAHSVRHDRARPSVSPLAAPLPKWLASFSGALTSPHSSPPLLSTVSYTFLGVSRDLRPSSSTDADEVP